MPSPTHHAADILGIAIFLMTGGIISYLSGRLRRREQQLKEAVAIREDFMTIASHELRTPLTALTLQLDVLARRIDGGGPEVRRLETALRQAQRLEGLISELLAVSRISTGKLRPHPEAVDLAALAREIVERMADTAARAGCELRVDARPVVGRWDPHQLDQVVTNLIGNALKYGAGHPVDVVVDGADGVARLVVRDHGIGIAPELVPRIFDRFERAVSSSHYGGLGLGLYIADQIVRAHGGRIEVATQPGEGATFTIVLPVG
jgi:signal transduction histidine kinase